MPRTKKQEKSEEDSKHSKSIKISEEDFEAKVVEHGKKGLTSEKIGEALRKEGIHPKEHSKKISLILKKDNLYVIPEMKNVEEKLERIRKHSEKHKQDKKAMREKNRVFAQVRIMRKYFGVEAK